MAYPTATTAPQDRRRSGVYMLVAMAAIFMTILGLGIAFLVALGSVRAVLGRQRLHDIVSMM